MGHAMNNEIAHWLVTFVLGGFAAVLAWIFTSTKSAHERQIAALETQNSAQERELATLKADMAHHGSSYDRLEGSIRRLDEKIDDLMRYLSRGRTPSPFPAVKGGAGHER